MAARRNTAPMSRKRRLRYWVGGFAMLAAIGTGASAFASGPDSSSSAAPGLAGASATSSADPSITPSITASPTSSPSTTAPAESSPTATPTPVVTYRVERERTSIAFTTRNVKTAALAKGVTKVKQPGRRGVRVSVYRLTFKDGVQTHRQLVNRYVARRPVPRIVLHGTYVKPKPQPQPSHKCDPNYSGCVPIASDVDCAGGSGNGPAYVEGPVRVIGTDIYGLDSDGDGWGCES